MAIRFAFAVALLLVTSSARAEEVSPVQKVVQLLGDMLAKSKEEKQDEAVAFAKFEQFCGDEQVTKAEEIKQANEAIESLTAEIEKAKSDSTVLGQDLAQLGTDLDKFEADQKAHAAEREQEHSEFVATLRDYEESLDALDRAIIVLKRRLQDVKQPGSASLLQLDNFLDELSTKKLPQEAKRFITAFAQMQKAAQEPEDDDGGFMGRSAPEANAYEFQSGGIIDMLENLKDKFRKEKGDLEKEEMNSKHASQMMLQDLGDSIEQNKDETAEKSALKSKKDERAAADTKELQATVADRDEDSKYLSDLKAECEQKKLSFDEKQELRAGEIEAISQAIDILSSASVSGAAEKHLGLVVVKTKKSFVQLRVRNSNNKAKARVDPHVRVARFLKDESRRLKSRSLGLLAEQVAHAQAQAEGADPFAKVKAMIEAMITRLLKEANEEAEQKGFCDKELNTNKITRDKLTTSIDTLAAEVEGSNALIAKLGEEISTLNQELADLDKAVATYTEDREVEKAKNAVVIKDAQDAQSAVDAARVVLKDFYTKAAQATALLQDQEKGARPKMGGDEWNSLANPNFKGKVDKGHKAGMQTFGETYTGQQDAAGNVLAFLEVIQSDFANLEADTKAAEKAAAKAYQAFIYDSDKSKAVKSKDVEMKSADKQGAEAKLLADTKDMKATQDELLAADRYYEKLKPHCVAEPVSFEDRQKARQEEIASLREALEILEGTDIA